MKSAIEKFRISSNRVRDMVAIYKSVKYKTTPALDLSDILRAALVLAISALDYYVHEIVRIGMLEIHRGERPQVPRFSSFQISLGRAISTLNSSQNNDLWLEIEIREQHSYKSFQQPEKIAEAIRLISDKKLWEEVADRMGDSPTKIKQKLEKIVKRRNQIAHEADINPDFSDVRQPIDELFVSEAVEFIEQVVESIHKIL